MASEQEEAIKRAALAARAERDAFAAQRIGELEKVLSGAASSVQFEIASLKSAEKIKAWQEMRLSILRELEGNIESRLGDLKTTWRVGTRPATEGALRLGIEDGVSQLAAGDIPEFSNLSKVEKNKKVLGVFSTIDDSAVTFAVKYRMALLGEVSDELEQAIRQTVTQGMLEGKSIDDVARRVGTVIDDPEEFRKAGKTVFKTAQHRARLIAHTETMRAHNEGRRVFYKSAKVDKVRWLTANDARVCDRCLSRHNVKFDVNDVSGPPLHPGCRCTVVAVLPSSRSI